MTLAKSMIFLSLLVYLIAELEAVNEQETDNFSIMKLLKIFFKEENRKMTQHQAYRNRICLWKICSHPLRKIHSRKKASRKVVAKSPPKNKWFAGFRLGKVV